MAVKSIGYVFLWSVILLLAVALSTCQYQNVDVVTVTVTDKERVVTEDFSKYLIYTENETFQNTDMLFIGKYNSSDIYGKIKEEETYRFEVSGYRIPFFSQYRNIRKIME